MCQDSTARIIIKQGSGVPTIPVSTDHRNGDWLATDIYEGEQYQDTDTGVIYTRNGVDIVPIGGGSSVLHRQWKAQIGQTGTSAPTLNVVANTLGVTAVPSRTAVGVYNISGFNSNLTGNWEVVINFNFNDTAFTKSYTVTASTSSVLNFATYVSGTYTDGVIQSSTTAYYTITINKYD